MPWDRAAKQKLSSKVDRTGKLILQAQKAEFSLNSLPRALNLLNQALSLAASASQKSFIRLQMGRILVKSGDISSLS